MGFSRYWTFDFPKGKKAEAHAQSLYNQAVGDIEHLCRAYNAQYPKGDYRRLSGYSAHGAKHYDGVKFNGRSEYGCEDFILRERMDLNDATNFCKTRELPYDVVVNGALCILKWYLGLYIDLSADTRKPDWADGLALAQRLLHKDYSTPETAAPVVTGSDDYEGLSPACNMLHMVKPKGKSPRIVTKVVRKGHLTVHVTVSIDEKEGA